MDSRQVMIAEAQKAKEALHREMLAADRPSAEWLKDRAEALDYYNRLLVRLGAGPKG